MKKLCAFLLMALMMVPVWAGADDYFIPDPGHFFGETMVKTSSRNYTMYFDKDPRDMFNAYVSLLQTDYEMKKLSITDTDHIFTYDGVHDSGVTISYISSKDGYRIDVTLHSLVSTGNREQYDPDWAAEEEPTEENSAAKGQVAWDNGRMIADPGDFLGYEIAVTDILDMTDYKYGGYYFTRYYEEIDMADILKYIDALDASPYFKKSSTSDAKSASYRIVNFMYTGPDSDLAALCKDSHRNKRTCDLYIHIDYRNRERSTFRITSYPGFTVDSVDYVPEPTPGPIPDDRQDCIFCDNGSCKTCGGSGFVYQYAAGFKDTMRRVSCNSCLNGRCTFCDGQGWR